PVEPWVAAVARARAIDALRARKRRAPFEQELTPEAMSEVPDRARDSEDALATRGEVDAALAGLSPGQRAAVRMLKIEELSLSEAALASGQSIPALKSLLHRAMLTLRASLGGGNDA
ncbi:MAG: sigma-70 family RNA polymerase sigma factor, partial [Alphaproteobacteria bacterium]|nr:sigma-70 family RNA polymerase sigma factor [Alphaproteobacteria bacterium]